MIRKIWNIISVGAAIVWDGIKEFWGLANITPGIGILFCGIFPAAIVWPGALWLLALAPVAFVQNMFFTLVSRSRNSQDPSYHRFCAWGSNGVWFICQVLIVKNIWTSIHAGQYWYAILAGIVYSLATTEGSVLMMKRLIKSEKGKRRVGANDKMDTMESRIKVLEFNSNEIFDPKKTVYRKDDRIDKIMDRIQVLERMINVRKRER